MLYRKETGKMNQWEAITQALAAIVFRLRRIEMNETAPNVDADLSVSLANLPSGFEGRRRYCNNCLKVGESTGSGTGTVVYYSNGAWRRVRDDTAAAS
jgi:hypothetical protein